MIELKTLALTIFFCFDRGFLFFCFQRFLTDWVSFYRMSLRTDLILSTELDFSFLGDFEDFERAFFFFQVLSCVDILRLAVLLRDRLIFLIISHDLL